MKPPERRPRVLPPPTDQEVAAAIAAMAHAIQRATAECKRPVTLTVHDLQYRYGGPAKRVMRLIGVRPLMRHKLYLALGGPDRWGPKPKYTHGRFQV